MVNISGISKGKVLAALYNASHPHKELLIG